MARAVRIEATVDSPDLKRLRKELKALEGDTPWIKQLKEAGREAAEIVASEARGRVKVKSGKFRDSIRAKGLQTGGRLEFGGKTAPWGPVNEFGGSVPNRGAGGSKLMRSRELLQEMGIVQGKQKKSGISAASTLALRQARSGRHVHKVWKKSGYFIFPALGDKHDEVAAKYQAALDKITAAAFPRT